MTPRTTKIKFDQVICRNFKNFEFFEGTFWIELCEGNLILKKHPEIKVLLLLLSMGIPIRKLSNRNYRNRNF